MKTARAALVGTFLLAATSCGKVEPASLPPLGQLLVHVDTDAPLPVPAGETLGPNDPPPLFDRLRLEVFRPGETAPCPDCTHEFDVDRALFAAGRASIGITPPIATRGYRVRARLFRAAFVDLGQPRADATLDTIAELPPIAAEGVTEVTVMLSTDDVARPVGTLDAPALPLLGPPARRVGTWPGAQRRPCTGQPGPGEVCVPGGAYWMGNPLTRAIVAQGDEIVLRLAVLSPFFLDATEVTVPAFRASGLAAPKDPMPYDKDDGTPGPRLHCTYQPKPGDTDALPVNCISWSKAYEYCQAHGATLPTEAQFQYAASGLAGRLYVWGDDLPTCDDAVYLRTGQFTPPDYVCPGGWVDAPGQGHRDRLDLPGGTITDLAGNVSEHVLDLWNLQKESCWGTGVFYDPLCTARSADPHAHGQHTVVGGNYLSGGGFVAASTRTPAIPFPDKDKDGPAGGYKAPLVTAVGFRCARPDR